MVLFKLMNNKYYQYVYEYMLYASYILYAIAFTGIYNIDPNYLTMLNSFIVYYVCLFLLIKFNPYIEISSDDYDCKTQEFNRKIAFSAGIYLLLTTSITKYVLYYLQNKK